MIFTDSITRFLEALNEGAVQTNCCCDATQIEIIVVICVTGVFTALLWRNAVFAPLKLVAVFLHEFSHASATVLTCGRVRGIEVNENFGGMTLSQGGIRWIVLSAGYTGSVLWGSFFILMGWERRSTRVGAVVFMVACITTAITLRIKEKRLCGTRCMVALTLRMLIVLLAALPAGLWALEDAVKMPIQPLRLSIIAFGTVCTLHALYDCLHDVLLRKIDNAAQGQSDAVMFANEIGGHPRMWGLLWSVIALSFTGLALFGLIVLTSQCNIV